MALLTLMGLMEWEPNLFEGLELPEGVDRQKVVDNIVLECAELEVVYPVPQFMKRAITLWSYRQIDEWNRFYSLNSLEYNPIENYDRQESETTGGTSQHSGTDTTRNNRTGSETRNYSSEDETAQDDTYKVAAYDSNTMVEREQENHEGSASRSASESASVTDAGSQTLEHGEKITDTGTRVSRIHGNIGVTTSQQMIESEIELIPKLNFYSRIVDEFKRRFCILVY